MQRVYWTLDLLEAHIVADFLRAQGVDAQVFDADFVRQNWLASLAYGGFRVVAPDEECGVAKRLIADLRANAFALESDQSETPECPRCGSHTAVENPTPRRIASVLLLFFSIPGIPFKWRYRCTACGMQWKAPPEHAFRDLADAADAAEPPA